MQGALISAYGRGVFWAQNLSWWECQAGRAHHIPIRRVCPDHQRLGQAPGRSSAAGEVTVLGCTAQHQRGSVASHPFSFCLASLFPHFFLSFSPLLFLGFINSQRDSQQAELHQCQRFVVWTLRSHWKDAGMGLALALLHFASINTWSWWAEHLPRQGEQASSASHWAAHFGDGRASQPASSAQWSSRIQLTASRDMSTHGSIYIHSFKKNPKPKIQLSVHKNPQIFPMSVFLFRTCTVKMLLEVRQENQIEDNSNLIMKAKMLLLKT